MKNTPPVASATTPCAFRARMEQPRGSMGTLALEVDPSRIGDLSLFDGHRCRRCGTGLCLASAVETLRCRPAGSRRILPELAAAGLLFAFMLSMGCGPSFPGLVLILALGAGVPLSLAAFRFRRRRREGVPTDVALPLCGRCHRRQRLFRPLDAILTFSADATLFTILVWGTFMLLVIGERGRADVGFVFLGMGAAVVVLHGIRWMLRLLAPLLRLKVTRRGDDKVDLWVPPSWARAWQGLPHDEFAP